MTRILFFSFFVGCYAFLISYSFGWGEGVLLLESGLVKENRIRHQQYSISFLTG